mmetsp:Transcript_46244/g.88250  ORF Transcript_46244/g.88250 Transcript_46244/m.88250 type:complete len:491 (-) Transcript_46244:338-1810(-)
MISSSADEVAYTSVMESSPTESELNEMPADLKDEAPPESKHLPFEACKYVHASLSISHSIKPVGFSLSPQALATALEDTSVVQMDTDTLLQEARSNLRGRVRDAHGHGVLHAAAMAGHVKAVALLVQLGAEPQEADGQGVGAAHYAAYHGHVTALKCMHALGFDLKMCTEQGLTPAHYAAFNGKVEALHCLQHLGVNLSLRSRDGQTAAHSAAKGGHCEVLRMLKRCGASLDALTEAGMSPLHFAARGGWTYAVQDLAALGAQTLPVPVCARGFTPLHYAAHAAHPHTLLNLCGILAPRALEMRTAMGHTALHLAAMNGCDLAVHHLACVGADLNAASGGGGMTALHYAAKYGHVDVIVALRNGGASIEVRNSMGRHPLHYAEQLSSPACAQALKWWRWEHCNEKDAGKRTLQERSRWRSFLPAWASGLAPLMPEKWFDEDSLAVAVPASEFDALPHPMPGTRELKSNFKRSNSADWIMDRQDETRYTCL